MAEAKYKIKQNSYKNINIIYSLNVIYGFEKS